MNRPPVLALVLVAASLGSSAVRADSPSATPADPQSVNCRVEVEGSDAETKFHAEALVGVGRSVVLSDRNFGLTVDALRVVDHRCHLRFTYDSHAEVKNGYPRHEVADALLPSGRRTTMLKGSDFTLAATATIE